MRAWLFVSESAQWQTISCADHSRGAGRHCIASFGTRASAALSRAGPAAYCARSDSRSARVSIVSAPREIPAQDLGERLGGEAELEERLALVEVLAVSSDLPSGELEDA